MSWKTIENRQVSFNKISILALLLLFALTACSGVESITRKRWETHQNTIILKDLTKKFSLQGASSGLRNALETEMTDSMFMVVPNNVKAKYHLKFQVTMFDHGNRFKRFVTFGIDDGSRALMNVKVALLSQEGMLGAWEVQSWVSGGMTGGSPDKLYEKAAQQILKNLRGL